MNGQAGGDRGGRGGQGRSGQQGGGHQHGGQGRGGQRQGRGARGSGAPRQDGPVAVPPRRRPVKPHVVGDVPRVRRDVHADLRATAPPKELDDVLRVVVAARDAVEAGEPERAIELLTWAKAVAPRSVVVRETLGIAAYHAGEFENAHRELLAYRRMSHRQDQNHLLADCARALGRYDKIDEYVAAMAGTDVHPERLAEAAIVQAGARADRGDFEGAIATLERAGLDSGQIRPHHLRLWYTAADLYERSGDLQRAREYFEAVTTVDEDFLDAEERLRDLST